MVDGDAVRLAQALSNLLNNAAKYTGKGGRIAIEAKRDGEMAEIRVSDNGAGIAPDAQPRLFQMFSRLGPTSDPGQGGLGIGLALARRLAEMLGPEVRVVHDGRAALDAIAERPCDVMLLDIGMPGMDGYEVARTRRDRSADSPVFLVALTGWGQEKEKRQALEAGFDHHMVKPADVRLLQKLLSSPGELAAESQSSS